MSRHHILYIHSSNELYGSDRSLLRLVQGLDKEKYKPHVIVANDLQYQGLLTDRLKASEVTYSEFKLGVLRRKYQNLQGMGLFSYRTLQSTRYIAEYCRANQISLIHTNSTAVFSGGLAAKRLGLPHIWHVREIITQPVWLNKIIASALNRYADTIVAVSGPARDQLLAAKPEIKNKIVVVNNGINQQPFIAVSAPEVKRLRKLWGASDSTIIIGMIGRLNSWKGQEFLLDAASSVMQSRDNVRFVFVGGNIPGEEWRAEKLQAKIDKLALTKDVYIDGFRFDIPEVMAAFDVFVLPSTKPDPYPTVVLEAMASGKPVIATAHGGPLEQVLDGETGYLVSPTSTQQLADALKKLIADPERRNCMGRAGHLRLINNFTTERYVRNIEGLYKQPIP